MSVSSCLWLLCAFTATAAATIIDFRAHKRLTHNLYYLGEHVSPHRRNELPLERYAFLHYHDESETATALRDRPSPSNFDEHFGLRGQQRKRSAEPLIGDELPSRSDECVSRMLGEGAHWWTSRGYYIMGANMNRRIGETELVRAVALAVRAWQCRLRSRAARMAVGPLLGVDMSMPILRYNIYKPDGMNMIGFCEIEGVSSKAMAVTLLSGRFRTAEGTRELVEFDMCLNDRNFRFGNASLQADVVDLLAQLTHEFGHVYGLCDVNGIACRNDTMYAFSTTGLTRTRTPKEDDVRAINRLNLV
jgi:hypothetical protein